MIPSAGYIISVEYTWCWRQTIALALQTLCTCLWALIIYIWHYIWLDMYFGLCKNHQHHVQDYYDSWYACNNLIFQRWENNTEGGT